MNEEVKTYISLNKDTFESIMKRANQEAIDSDVNDEDRKNELLFSNAKIRIIRISDFFIEEEQDILKLDGTLFAFGRDLGWIGLEIPLNQEIAIGIIERYLEKLGKLKTVLEVTK